MMDDVAAKLKMDPVEFIRANMTRKSRDTTDYTNYTPEECPMRRGDARLEITVEAGAGPTADRSSVARAYRSWRFAPALDRAAPSSG